MGKRDCLSSGREPDMVCAPHSFAPLFSFPITPRRRSHSFNSWFPILSRLPIARRYRIARVRSARFTIARILGRANTHTRRARRWSLTSGPRKSTNSIQMRSANCSHIYFRSNSFFLCFFRFCTDFGHRTKRATRTSGRETHTTAQRATERQKNK